MKWISTNIIVFREIRLINAPRVIISVEAAQQSIASIGRSGGRDFKCAQARVRVVGGVLLLARSDPVWKVQERRCFPHLNATARRSL